MSEFIREDGDAAKKTLTFGFVWDNTNPNFHPQVEYQNIFFRAQQNYINDRLKAGKFITVNDVADMLGFSRSPQCMVYGWDSDEAINFLIRRNDDGSITLELVASNIYEQFRGV